MISLQLLLIALVVAAAAGAFGALVGVGGGLILVPVLTIVVGVDVKTAIGISLLGVIAVSTSASASYLKAGFTDRRLAISLLIATALGGIAGGYISGFLDSRTLTGLFAVVLIGVAIQMFRFRGQPAAEIVGEPSRLEFDRSYVEPTTGTEIAYRARRLPLAMFVSLFAGALSGLLGIGGGVVNVPTMNLLMGVPIRVATATSTFMLGATAAASAVLYLSRGQIDPSLAAPVVAGVLVGAVAGARAAPHVPRATLTLFFVAVAAVFAAQMLLRFVGA